MVTNSNLFHITFCLDPPKDWGQVQKVTIPKALGTRPRMNLTKKSATHLKVVKLVHRNLQSTNTTGRIRAY